ncbi:hypothetical protein CVT25_004441 [Psilocybe cyanescens]|uniref:Uncharacterized protein n=1 Tax=Psilocybe cyanescens TaxID=93625 RepID=A0A409XMI8_PSICY|nr:hypothetical protein CVT25_004441 [Psilocybe cyanescens]
MAHSESADVRLMSDMPADWDVTDKKPVVLTTPLINSVLQYTVPTLARILSMSASEDNKKSLPFMQRIQLIGGTGTVVRATGQVDNGAMWNCISKDRWIKYSHCLDPLEKSHTIISVANSNRIHSMGRWFGKVQVGSTSALSGFEVFDCQGAFDVILGKPWLRAVRAKHDYETDSITIGSKGNQEILTNDLEDTQSQLSTPLPIAAITQHRPAMDQLLTPPPTRPSKDWMAQNIYEEF